MRKSITFVLIFAIFMAVFMWFPGSKENVDMKQTSLDAGVSEPATQVIEPQDTSASISNQEAQNDPARPNNGQQLDPEIEKALNELVITSHEGLVEEETDKGVFIDLKGRFRTAPVATIDDKGQIIVQDYTSAPGR